MIDQTAWRTLGEVSCGGNRSDFHAVVSFAAAPVPSVVDP